MYELGGAKQAGSTYAHGGPAGKRGRSLREGRKNAPAPLRPIHHSISRPPYAADEIVVTKLFKYLN